MNDTLWAVAKDMCNERQQLMERQALSDTAQTSTRFTVKWLVTTVLVPVIVVMIRAVVG